MQGQERDLISGLFGRIQQFETQPRDPEAEALISSSIARQPAAPYLLIQTVLVQEQALKAAQERIAELEAKVSAAPAAATSFLGNAPKVSPWGSQAGGAQAGDTPPARPSMVPSTRSPLQAAVAPAAAPAGGSFLRTAMATAAGVAGGALLFQGISSMMGNNPFGQQQAAAQPPAVPDAQPQQAMAQDDSQMADGASEDYDTASLDQDMGGGGDDFA
ncbi:MAG: DUF2076 domain-containing protein [Reyranella sp.]|nr:DUF2076 domain-containing protein [Reyranella sp.]MDP3162585.1 DUF2076 domain-containing protein [Reyranella sp.]